MHNLDISYMHPSEENTNDMPTRRRRSCSSERSFSRDSETGERISVLISAGDGKSKVRFYRFSSVVLIPSRTEYRAAKCDLWWQREDFVGFQQAASSELRMLCNIDKIGVREARRRLYQPENAKDAERRHLHDLGGDYSASSSAIFGGQDSDSDTDDTNYSNHDNVQQIHSPAYSRQTSHVDLTSTSNNNCSKVNIASNKESLSDMPEHLIHSPSKLSLRVFQSAGNLAALASEAMVTEDAAEEDGSDIADLADALANQLFSFSPTKNYNTTYYDTTNPYNNNNNQQDITKPQQPSLPRLRHWNLQLCVPLKPFTVPLVLEPAHSSHHSLGHKSSRAQREADNGFLAVMGFCSFALPIVGYLMFNNSKFSIFQTFS